MIFIDIASVACILLIKQSIEKISNAEHKGNGNFDSQRDGFSSEWSLIRGEVVVNNDVVCHLEVLMGVYKVV